MLDLAALAELDRAATPGPWHVRFMDDDMCMTAIAIGTVPDRGDHEALCDGAVFGVVAATLIQHRSYIMRDDGRERENAELISAMRNAFPELLRLAAIGLEQGGGSGGEEPSS